MTSYITTKAAPAPSVTHNRSFIPASISIPINTRTTTPTQSHDHSYILNPSSNFPIPRNHVIHPEYESECDITDVRASLASLSALHRSRRLSPSNSSYRRIYPPQDARDEADYMAHVFQVCRIPRPKSSESRRGRLETVSRGTDLEVEGGTLRPPRRRGRSGTARQTPSPEVVSEAHSSAVEEEEEEEERIGTPSPSFAEEDEPRDKPPAYAEVKQDKPPRYEERKIRRARVAPPNVHVVRRYSVRGVSGHERGASGDVYAGNVETSERSASVRVLAKHCATTAMGRLHERMRRGARKLFGDKRIGWTR